MYLPRHFTQDGPRWACDGHFLPAQWDLTALLAPIDPQQEVWAAGVTYLPIRLEVLRQGQIVYQGETSSRTMKRSLPELAGCLGYELSFPGGVFLMTGAGIVPGDDFSLAPGDTVQIQVGERQLKNSIRREFP